jgi:hypothetical protein
MQFFQDWNLAGVSHVHCRAEVSSVILHKDYGINGLVGPVTTDPVDATATAAMRADLSGIEIYASVMGDQYEDDEIQRSPMADDDKTA